MALASVIRRASESSIRKWRSLSYFVKCNFVHKLRRPVLSLGVAIMPKFNVGDHVERVGPLVPTYMQRGVITRVIPDKGGIDWLSEYEVNFDNKLVANFYETQLRLVKAAPDSN